jgi:hypothetical protein
MAFSIQLELLQDLLSPGANAKSTASRDCGGSKVVKLLEGAAPPAAPSDLTAVSRGENMFDKRPPRLGTPSTGDPAGDGGPNPNNAPRPLRGDEGAELDIDAFISKLPPPTGRFASLVARCLTASAREKAGSSSSVPENCAYAHRRVS